MKIHEYQAKAILARHGVPVPRGEVAFNAAEAGDIARRLGGDVVVVKAQIHAGGRGKGGGVKLAKSPDEAEQLAARDARHDARHASDRARRARRVARARRRRPADDARAVSEHRARSRVRQAGHDGERRRRHGHRGGRRRHAREDRQGLHRAGRRPGAVRGAPARVRASASTAPQVNKAVKLMTALYDAFVATDASLVEINPLVVTAVGDLLALDAKMNFDDNALYRHPDIRELRDLGEEDPLEIEASKFSLNYIHLDGNIGCMVNGAGLAMATMDIIKLAGGEPANFLDVGGGANAEQIRNAFRILMSDKNVKAVLINIFGGILRCDVLAQGVIAAVKELGVPVPIVIRMEGTNVDEGKRLLRESGMNFTTADCDGRSGERKSCNWRVDAGSRDTGFRVFVHS